MDFDGDGQKDLVSGCFEGWGYFVKGFLGVFAKPTPILDTAGNNLRISQFWNYETKKWDKVEDAEFGDLAIALTPVDWDADGDFDLLFGSFEGHVFLRTNSGSATKPAFDADDIIQIEAGGKPLAVPSRHAMPVVADWDHDGRWDLVTGSAGGAVYWYRNTGEAGAPQFDTAELLVVPGGNDLDTPGRRTQVAVGDWDGDGRNDLLVGDYRSSKSKTGKREMHGWVWLYRRLPAVEASAEKAPAKSAGR